MLIKVSAASLTLALGAVSVPAGTPWLNAVVVEGMGQPTTTLDALVPQDSTPLAVWEMNEPAGTDVMLDDTGNGRDGTVGSAIITGHDTGSEVGYRWTFKPPNQLPVEPERLVTVPDSAGVDPQDQVFTITFRYRTTQNFGNYFQKGQARTPGGQIKIQGPKGKVGCMFRGSLGRTATSSRTPLNDGEWHVVACRRDSNGVTMYVDGEFRNRNRKASGYIDNSFPLTIGGKPKCDQVKITCDYFTGEFDYIRIDVG